MKSFKDFLFAALAFIAFAKLDAQDNCGKRDVFYRFDRALLKDLSDSVLLEQYTKLYLLENEIAQSLENNTSLHPISIAKNINLTQQHGYLLEGTVTNAENEYKLQLTLQTTCSNKVLARVEIIFPMYPSWEEDKIAAEAVQKLKSLANIEEFESNERDTKKYGFGGDLWGGRILIDMNKKMTKGEEVPVTIKVMDCDGMVLNNKQISTEGTIGGVFTPAAFQTNSTGVATVKFKMATDKTAIVKTQSEIKNVLGCQDLYTGTEIVKGAGSIPVKIEVTYSQDETHTVKQATLPSIKVAGGETAEKTTMYHYSVMYHYPSPESLKKGFLVAASKSNEFPGSKTINVTEFGWFDYSRNTGVAKIKVQYGNASFYEGTEDASESAVSGVASLQHPSEVHFFMGDPKTHTPASFDWNVEYPAFNDNVASGAIGFSWTDVTGPNVWKERKITDPKSLYKTEYYIKYTLNAAEELRKGNAVMKQLFGFDVDGMTKIIDPTNPQTGVAGASGKQSVTVRILSPY